MLKIIISSIRAYFYYIIEYYTLNLRRDSRKIQRIPEEIRYPHKALENRVGLLNSWHKVTKFTWSKRLVCLLGYHVHGNSKVVEKFARNRFRALDEPSRNIEYLQFPFSPGNFDAKDAPLRTKFIDEKKKKRKKKYSQKRKNSQLMWQSMIYINTIFIDNRYFAMNIPRTIKSGRFKRS